MLVGLVTLDAKGQGRDIEQEDILDIASQDAALDGCADGDNLVGVDGPVGLFAKELFDDFLDLGDAC